MFAAWVQRLFAAKKETDKARCGRLAEDAAQRMLKGKGYKVLARNWRSGRYEIDLICRSGDALVFVEVRARQAGAYVGGYHSINRQKKNALRKGAYAYLQGLPKKPTTHRYDLIQVALTPDGTIAKDGINHYENIRVFS